MFDELDMYLGNITTPENRAAIMRSCEALEKAGVLSHESDIEQILRTADNHTTENNLLDVFSLLTEYLGFTIQQFGLTVEEGIPLSILCHILDGLLDIPNYGDAGAIHSALEQELDAETRLCDVFSIVSSLSWHNFTPYITQVSETLLPTIEESIRENILPEEPVKDIQFYRQRVNNLRTVDPDTLALSIIKEGFRLATPLNALVGRFHDDLDELENQPTSLAGAVLAILYVSDTPNDALIETGGDLLEEYAKDINVTTKAHTAFTRLLKEVQDA